MIRIRTPSRLHFGLLSLPSVHAPCWLNQEGDAVLPRRQFGGIGLMIDQPGIELTVRPATTWSARGPLAERALGFARTYCGVVGIPTAFDLHVVAAAPEHAGLGTGTQLGLAVARAIAEHSDQPERDAVSLALGVGRGLRSALGIHGFERGGFLVEGGKIGADAVAPLIAHGHFPAAWAILLLLPHSLQGAHGERESEAFAQLGPSAESERTTEALCRIALLGLLPALAERDLPAFGEALYDFNRRAGEMFKSAQGGVYAHPRITRITEILRGAGIKGVGQSSWGPSVFAVVPGEQVNALQRWLGSQAETTQCEVLATSACQRGAIVVRDQ